MDYPARRRGRLARLLREEKVDAFLITNPVNVTYLTGFSGDSSYLVLGRRRSLLVSDARFSEQITEECPGLETHIRPLDKTVHQAATEVLERLGFRDVGYESATMTVADLEMLSGLAKTVRWKPGRDRVEKMRAVKDPSEVAQIREAIGIAERAFAMFQAMLRPEDSEKDLSDQLEYYIRRAGGRCSSFPSIIAVGERAALPHAPPTDRRVEGDGLLLVDWGASGPFYQSDLTRVLAGRKISPKLEKVYAVVLKAQGRAIRAIRPGVKGSEVDAAARSVITDAGYGAHFGHGLGHGLGLQVHEAPALRQNSEAVLEPGMVATVEPGIYLPGWGGVRIEDDVLVTPDGCEVLTSVPKDPPPVWGEYRAN
jgi:Xaa-Pro aminopeptidase